MDTKELRRQAESIATDTSRSIEDRLEDVLALGPDDDDSNDDNDDDPDYYRRPSSIKLEAEIILYSTLIDMLWREANDHSRDITMLQLYVLLAEAYDQKYDYRPMKKVAEGVLRLMRDRQTPAEIYRQTIPRLTAAIGNSVYHSALYEILLMYVKRMFADNSDDESLKPLARKLVKLHILLEYNPWQDREWNKDFQKALSRLFSADELMAIIANPKIGHLKCDPVEYTHRWEQIYYDVEAELDERFANAPKHMGLCFRIWSAKQNLLKEKYGIEWRSPAQMNPQVMFD